VALLVFPGSGLIGAVASHGKSGFRGGSHLAVGVGAGLSDILIDHWIAKKFELGQFVLLIGVAITATDKHILEGRPST
jgi:hypothetical protein